MMRGGWRFEGGLALKMPHPWTPSPSISRRLARIGAVGGLGMWGLGVVRAEGPERLAANFGSHH